MYLGHLDLEAQLVWTVDNALTLAECEAYEATLRANTLEVAPIVGEDGAPAIDLEVRNNTRFMWDDEAEANSLLACVKHAVPAKLLGMVLAGANPRLRLYRYEPGQRHGTHWDTVVELGDHRSLLTLAFYVNDDFEGGETDFPELEKRIKPQRGRALLFQHRILHEAMPVLRGTKIVLRTDILYRPLSE